MQNAHRFHHIGIVRQWLAHTHEDDIGDAFRGGKQCIQCKYLFNDLSCRQVSLHAAYPRCTKFTSHRTADLGTDAGGAPTGVGDHHRLGVCPIRPSQQQLDRPVFAALLCNRFRGCKIYIFCEARAIGNREIVHPRRFIDELFENPVAHLICPKARPVPASNQRVKLMRR